MNVKVVVAVEVLVVLIVLDVSVVRVVGLHSTLLTSSGFLGICSL